MKTAEPENTDTVAVRGVPQKVKICLADLTHTGQIVAANTIPIGISMIAANAIDKFDDELEIELFRYPDDFGDYLNRGLPRIAGFSNYSWNLNLGYAFAREIKATSPDTVIVFGGPNYSAIRSEQIEFLTEYPLIDFCVDGEGEIAFADLYEALREVDFDAAELRRSKRQIGNTHYLAPDETFVRGPVLPRLESLDAYPSPYLTGLNDKFFDDTLIPMMQTSRGCPYSCSFCHEGSSYYTKVKRATSQRIAAELEYIASRARAPDFTFVDSNFGIFEDDLETCRILAKLKEKYHWPRHVFVSSAKNNKERVIAAASILPGAINPGAAVQTTNAAVLDNIKRRNLSLEQIVDVAKTAEERDANSFSEIILCLPGDTKEAHTRTVFDMVDVNINYIRMYQFMMLPGSEAATQEYRERFGIRTHWRALPRCFGNYGFDEHRFDVSEFEEISTSNSTMSFEDYLDCRALNLSVEIFHNGGIFFELRQLLSQLGVKHSEFLHAAHVEVLRPGSPFRRLYDDFRTTECRNLWNSREEIEAFFYAPGNMERYVAGEYGTNELYNSRAVAVFRMMPELHDVAFKVARDLLGTEAGGMDDYLNELKRFCLLRKENLLDPSYTATARFGYDFGALLKSGFAKHPCTAEIPGGMTIDIAHTQDQQDTIHQYRRQYGTNMIGLGRILLRSNIRALYRQVSPIAN